MQRGLLSRALMLFGIGAALVLALSLAKLDYPGWVVVPLLATVAMAVGLLYPLVLREKGDSPDISEVMRCVAVFVGIYQASNKIDFASYAELFVTLLALAVGMWWLFDRSQAGFLLSLSVTTLSTFCTHLVLQLSILNIEISFLYSRLWCVYFSGCITFGAIGRRLAAGD